MDFIWKFKWVLKRIMTYLDTNLLNTISPLATPLCINIEATNVCNLNCGLCPLDRSGPKGIINLDLYKKIVDQASEMKIGLLRPFVGGEPLLHKEIDYLISYANKKNLQVRMNTNGTMLTPEVTNKLLLTPLDHLVFSIDGDTPEEYNQMRVGADFSRTINNVVCFLKEKKKRKMKKPFVTILNMIYHDKNKSHLDWFSSPLMKHFKGLPVNEYTRISPLAWGDEVRKSQENSKLEPRGKYYVGCSLPWNHITVCWDGTVVSCCCDINGKQILGDLKKQSLKEIWHSKKMKELRKAVKNRDFKNHPLCKTCNLSYSNDYFQKLPSFLRWFKVLFD